MYYVDISLYTYSGVVRTEQSRYKDIYFCLTVVSSFSVKKIEIYWMPQAAFKHETSAVWRPFAST